MVLQLFPSWLQKFLQMEAASGLVMIAFAILALMIANSPFDSSYYTFITTPLSFGMGNHGVSLQWIIQDILMVLFFLVIGMELKREMCEGFLARRDQIILPLIAALAGMAIPAFLYYIINMDSPANLNGWAIPSATDIAFALCVLTLAGKHTPRAAKVFLLAIAIFDDLGAILIIAGFYSSSLAFTPLLLAFLGGACLYVLNRMRVTTISPYIIVGVYLWFCLHAAGIHTTIAGVIVGLAIPLHGTTTKQKSPLNYCIHILHPWVSYLILPAFAFTNAGIDLTHITFSMILEPLPIGIAVGLFAGKQLGIFIAAWLCVVSGMANRPEGTSWLQIYGISIIAGVGFTMSLFIGLLAFSDPHFHDSIKMGVIIGSLLSSLWGAIVLKIAQPKHSPL